MIFQTSMIMFHVNLPGIKRNNQRNNTNPSPQTSTVSIEKIWPETKFRNGLCGSHLLGEGDEHSCSDLLKNGAQWRDKYDQTCENYVKMEEWKCWKCWWWKKGVRFSLWTWWLVGFLKMCVWRYSAARWLFIWFCLSNDIEKITTYITVLCFLEE